MLDGGQQTDREPAALVAIGDQRFAHEPGECLCALMVAKRLTMSQRCALMAREASGGQQVDHEPVERRCA